MSIKEQNYLFGVTIPALGALVKDVEDEQQSHACREISLAVFYLREQIDNLVRVILPKKGFQLRATYVIYLTVAYAAGMMKADDLSICCIH